ncbi:TetR/AcrR family transcriptional regulator [bacterium D16-51]|nr:TetR/AcrR family transcriptional regulator [bacterium D16-59]RKI58328.1 TetR/AcrR family transcriptional regulator [bacterium D16-51]
MPPQAKFSRKEIISTALEITRENGLGAVTARELGARLKSSARPIFTVFENMEEVNKEVIKAAKEVYCQYIDKGLHETLAFRGVGMAYIQFAVKEPKLFQLLFMGEQGETSDMMHVLTVLDENYEAILHSVQKPYGLEREQADKLYRHLWIYSHGIATLCATKVCSFSGEEIGEMMTEVFLGLLEKMKRGEL